MHREKAESNEYNLRFLVEQQAHKIKACEKLKPNLTEILEKRLILLRSEVKRLKEDISQKSRKFCHQTGKHGLFIDFMVIFLLHTSRWCTASVNITYPCLI